MAIAVGDRVRDVEVRTMGPDGPQPVRTWKVLGRGRVALFAVPGAFTPGCSRIHLPGYVQNLDRLRASGVDTVACVAVNDPWVLKAWADSQGSEGILMLGDGNADFTRANGLEADMSGYGLGTRSKRYAAIIDDGVVTSLEVEPTGGIDVSSCESMLTRPGAATGSD
jgi:peroxiredoxin